MLHWITHRVRKTEERRSNQQVCDRCKFLYDISSEMCPHCGQLTDSETLKMMKDYRSYREGLGKGMLWLALLIFFLMVILNET